MFTRNFKHFKNFKKIRSAMGGFQVDFKWVTGSGGSVILVLYMLQLKPQIRQN